MKYIQQSKFERMMEKAYLSGTGAYAVKKHTPSGYFVSIKVIDGDFEYGYDSINEQYYRREK